MQLDQADEKDLIAVTEQAAIAAAQTMGIGDPVHSDQVAVESMRATLGEVRIAGRVVLGKGEHQRAPMLYVGEEVGTGEGSGRVDLAVCPLEGPHLCATGVPGAVAALAAAERGGLLRAPETAMEKLIVGPTAKGAAHLDAPVPENLRNIARAFGREVSDLTVVVLDRERHTRLIADIRRTGARIRLISDGDLSASISVAVRGTGVHAVMGIGGASEGVIAAAAMRCLGGEIQARLTALDDEQQARLDAFDLADPQRILTTEDLAPGNDIFVSCTGVTDGELLRGVRFFGGGGNRTSSLLLSSASRIVRFVDTIRREDPGSPVYSH